MRKLIVEEWLSLDGYAADKNNKLDFFPTTEANRQSDEDQLRNLEEVDTILLGRKTYELFVEYWPGATVSTEIIADKLNGLRKIVFSNTLQAAPWGKWPAADINSGDLVAEVKKLKTMIIIWGSISLAQLLIAENLVDEFRLQVCPTAIGGGKMFFPDSDMYKKLTLLDVKKYNTGVVCLHYKK